MHNEKHMGVLASIGYLLRTIWRADKGSVAFSFYKQTSEDLFAAFFVVYFTKTFYGIVQGGGEFSSVVKLLLIFCGIHVVIHIVSALHAYYIRLKRPAVYRHMFSAVMDKALHVELSEYEKPDFYDKFARALDECLSKAMDGLYHLTQAAGSGVAVAASMILVAAIDPVLIVFLIPPVIVSFWLGGQRNRLQFELGTAETPVRRAMDYAKRVFYEKKYAGEIRLYRIRDVLFNKHVRSYRERYRLTARYNKRIFVRMLIQQLAMYCVMSASISLYIAYVIKLRGTDALGAYVAVLVTAGYVTYKAGETVHMAVEAGKHCIFMNNYRDFLEREELARDWAAENRNRGRAGGLSVPAGERLGDIVFERVGFSYDGSPSPVIEGLSLAVRRGERVALVGENGAGKTTLVKLLMGLYPVSEGRILVNGREIGEYDGESYRARFGAVFQDLQIFGLSLCENVLMRSPQGEDDRRLAAEALCLAQFGDTLAKLPMGVDTPVTKEFDDNGFVCSGGQAQKIALARVFAKRPDIVVLDEPSSALDPVAEYYMYENMMEACEGRTVFFISHRLSSARLADRVFYLEGGRIEECGSHEELMSRGGRYAELFNTQARNYREESYRTVEGEALYGG